MICNFVILWLIELVLKSRCRISAASARPGVICFFVHYYCYPKLRCKSRKGIVFVIVTFAEFFQFFLPTNMVVSE